MLYIVRHGETEWNRLRRVMGRCDEPLNDRGMEQALEAKKIIDGIDLDIIIYSPLSRARQTAEIINEDRKLEMFPDDRIMERDYGEFDGMNKSEFPYDDLWDYHLDRRFKEAEDVRDFFDRVYDFLEYVKKEYPCRNILLVTHGGVSMAVECYFRGYVPEGHLSGTGLSLKNCEVRSYSFQ